MIIIFSERKIIGATMSNECAAACIRNQARIDYVLVKIKQEKWNWVGHIMGSTKNCWSGWAPERIK